MKSKHLFSMGAIAMVFFVTGKTSAQGLSVNTTGSPAAASAILDASSTTKGMLVPRMDSAQRAVIGSPVNGLLVYQTDGVIPGFYFYNGSVWQPLGGGAPSGTAGGDLTGAYPNPNVATSAITSAKIADGTIANIDVSAAAAIAYGKLSLSNGIVNSDVNTSAGITYGKLDLSNSIVAGDLTANSVTIAKLPTGATGTTFLRGDGTWVTPSSGGSQLLLETISSVSTAGTSSAGIMSSTTGIASSTIGEVFVEQAFPVTGTLSNLNVRVITGTANAYGVIVTLYKNGAPTGLSCTTGITSSGTSLQTTTGSDTGDTVSVTPGDTLAYLITPTASNNNNRITISMSFQ